MDRISLQIDIDSLVNSASMDELRILIARCQFRLESLKQVRLNEEEQKIAKEKHISAIRLVRERTGISLLDAKLIVEGFLNGSAR